MAEDVRQAGWMRLASLATVVTATVAVVVALAGGTAWVSTYFAKEQILSHFQKCTTLQLDLLVAQMRAQNSYANYVNSKSNYTYYAAALSRKNDLPTLQAWPDLGVVDYSKAAVGTDADASTTDADASTTDADASAAALAHVEIGKGIVYLNEANTSRRSGDGLVEKIRECTREYWGE